MDSKTSLVILERVKAAREKQANQQQLPEDLKKVLGPPMDDLVHSGSIMGGGYGGSSVGALGGAAGGGALGLMLANRTQSTGLKRKLKQGLGLGLGGVGGLLAGGIGGGVLGSIQGDQLGQAFKQQGGVLGKQGNDPQLDAFAGAVQDMSSGQLKSEGWNDVQNIGLTALGVGAAGRGLVGLIQHLRANKPKKTRTGPAYLPLPFPASPEKIGAVMPAIGDTVSAAGGDLGATAGGAGGLALMGKLTKGMKPGKGRLALGVGGAAAGGLAGLLGGNQVGRGLAGRGATEPGAGQLSTAIGDNLASASALGGAGLGAAAGATAGMGGATGLHRLIAGAGKRAGGRTAMLGGLAALGLGGAGAVGGFSGGSSLMRGLLGRDKQGSFLGGDAATTKSGIPWYGPAMMLGGLGGLALGWKGMDSLIDKQRKQSMEDELDSARSEFHDALLGQYDKPVSLHPELIKKKASDDTMVKVGEALDSLYDKFVAEMHKTETQPMSKHALDLSNLAGQAAGGYGMYAGLSGLLTGALVYDKMSKRSRRSVLESALKKRQRRRFMQQPTEIYAQPEPVAVGAAEG